MREQLTQVLQQKFKFPAFRPGQLEAIEMLFSHHRLLCIQPTGYGKSLLYQLSSCILGGLTIVISPLLALMRDQIDQLTNRFQIAAGTLNSDQTEEENAHTRIKLLSGELQILFVSPEQLDHVDRFQFLLEQKIPISLLVIDEAHCISTWGHDFRPSYRHILQFTQALKQKHPALKILGLTATADRQTEKDIVEQLSMGGETVRVWREKMDRTNIHLSVLNAHGMAAKLSLLQTLLPTLPGHGLIYCSTRDHVEVATEYLAKHNFSIIGYHAGLEPTEKRAIQKAFSDNTYQIIAATTALGMGIDKKDLRFVIHFDIPGSITAYYQEVGRGGRDGLKAEGILLYDRSDRNVQEYFIDSALPTQKDFDLVLEAVRKAEAPSNLTAIKRITGLHPTRVTIVLAELLDQEFLTKTSLKGVQVYRLKEPAPIAPLNLTRYTTQHKAKTEELRKIMHFAEQTTQCRMTILCQSLGDKEPFSCGRCDVCKPVQRQLAPNPDSAIDWLTERPVVIAGAKTDRLSPGLSLIDSQLQAPLFIRFMKARAVFEEIDTEILALLLKHAATLPSIGAVVPLPSRTWKAGAKYAEALAKHFNVPLLTDLLHWQTVPEKRQGELLNNDQRYYNVHGNMALGTLPAKPTKGSIILFDDYIGTGATVKEAARVLRKKYDEPELIPLTIAHVKWRLGKPGFIL